MSRRLLACVFAVALACTAHPLWARSPEEVQALVDRAAAYIQEHGREKAFADFSRPDGGFVDGELYVFCYDASGIQLAHGGNPRLVGKNLSGIRDVEGKPPAVAMYRIAQTKGQGWYEYLWPNSASGRVERKVAYVKRIDDNTVCGSGYYRSDQPQPDKP